MATSFYQQIFNIVEAWAAENGTDIIDVDRAADWALATNRYQRIPISIKEQCKRDIRRALQAATHTDPQGNKVRTMHAVKGWLGEQMTFWIDSRTAKPDVMMEALKQSYSGIENDIKRHAIEKQSYDLNNLYGVTLPLFDYDFNALADVARASGEYDDSYDENKADEEDDDGDLD